MPTSRKTNLEMATGYVNHTSDSRNQGHNVNMNTGQVYNNRRPSTEPTSPTQTNSVGFRDPDYSEGEAERRKYLTAKYPQQQMRLIKKRLGVEDWLDQQLTELYCTESHSYDCTLDLDDLLDLDTESERRIFIMDKVSNCRQSQAVLEKFINDLMEKANTL